jgi:hypothetical protein
MMPLSEARTGADACRVGALVFGRGTEKHGWVSDE